MKKNTLLTIRPPIIMLILAASLCTLGIGYAAWSHPLSINNSLSSGSFDIIFAPAGPWYKVQITDINGRQIHSAMSADDVSWVLDEKKKQVRLSCSRALVLEELVEKDVFLMFRYPLKIGDDSTIQSVTPYLADLTLSTRETLDFTPVNSQFIIDGKEYKAPSGIFEVPLYWDVYRQIEMEGNQIVGTVFLKLNVESIKDLRNTDQLSLDAAELPKELKALIVPFEDATSGRLPAEVNVSYSFCIPLFIEQNHP